MTKDEALKLALEALEYACGDRCNAEYNPCFQREAITAIKEALVQPEQKFDTHSVQGKSRNTHSRQPEQDWIERERAVGYREGHQNALKQMAQPEQEPVAWKYDVTYNQDGTVSVSLPDGDELRIVLPNQQEPYCWTWDVWVSGGKWRAEYGWEKPTEKVVNLQPLYTTPPQRKPLTDKQILADETLRYYFGLNGGAGPVSKQGRKIVNAIEALHNIKETEK